jgi:hypothetical protein
VSRPFSSGPLRTRRARFPNSGLSSDYCVCRGGLVSLDGVVAGGTDDEGLASSFRHEFGPYRLWLSGPVEIGEFTGVVCLHLVRAVTDLAPVGKQPLDELLAAWWGWAGLAVGEDRAALPL